MKELRSLTSLRGIAALAVVMQHFSATAQKHAQGSVPSLVPHGYLAVDFFFVLSGFIMCYTYLNKFRHQQGAAYAPFLLRRAIRLLPLNAFVTTVLLGLGWLSMQHSGRNVFYGEFDWPFDLPANLLMLSGLGIGHLMNGTAWSVSTEFLAYLLFPLLLAGAFSRRIPVMLLTATAALAGLLAVALAGSNLGLGAEGPLTGSLRCVSEFTLGMLAYRYFAATRRSVWLGSGTITAGVLLLTLALYATRIDLLVALCFPLLVVAVAHNRGRIDTALSARPLHLLGVISYSLYLIHDLCRPLALGALQALHPQPLTTAGALAFAFVASLAVIPLAWLTYHGVEHRSRAWLQQRIASRGKRVAAQAKAYT